MEEREPSQKELFQEFSQPQKRLGRFGWFKKPISFRPLVFVFSYEKFIFLIISLVIILAVVFSLGVEQGKRIKSSLKTQTSNAVPDEKRVLPPISVPALYRSGTGPAPAIKIAPSVTPAAFTIQVATFAERNSAEKEIAGLKNKGYQAYMLSSGKYFIVCLGSFNDKQQAKALLAKLKITYKDAYIKKK